MIRLRVLGAAAALLLLLVLLLASAPAHLLSRLLADTPVAADGLTGTLWNGRASRVRLVTNAGALHLGEVRWALRPWSLLTLTPRLQFSSEWGNQRLRGLLELRGQRDIILSDLQAGFDAALLRHVAPVSLTGALGAQVEKLHLRDGLPVAATARVTWQQAAWDSPQGLLPLGSYALDVQSTAPGQLAGTVITLSGPVRAEGQLQLQQRDYSIAILITHESTWDPLLREALALLARPLDAGYDLRFDGSLPSQ